jgi:hypothetical protein
MTERLLTIARVRMQPAHADVMFFETARIYRLPRTLPGFDAALQVLRDAEAARANVVVEFETPNSAVISAVRPAG